MIRVLITGAGSFVGTNIEKWLLRVPGEFEVDWVEKDVDNTIHNIKDKDLLNVNDLIASEKAEGRAKHVIWIPRWMVVCGYYCIRLVFGKSNKTYLLFKALRPFRTKYLVDALGREK